MRTLYLSCRERGRLANGRSRAPALLISLTVAALAAASTLAQPAWYDVASQSGIQPGSPDFYQHQTTELQDNKGWCFQTSFEDAMYYDHNNGFANLYLDNANWVTAMNNNLANIISFTNSPPNFMAAYIKNAGYGATLGVTEIDNSGAGGFSMFNSFTNNLLSGSNVLLFLEPHGQATNTWWGTTFHVVDAVGFGGTNHSVIVLDPDNNKYGGFGYPPGSKPFNLVDYTNTEPMPIENGWADVGGPTNSYLQSWTVDANGNLTSGDYADAQIAALLTIGAVPEPSPVALGLVSAVCYAGYRLARRKKTVDSC
jgi:hypothetical protein